MKNRAIVPSQGQKQMGMAVATILKFPRHGAASDGSGRKSSAVTAPHVTDLIRTKMSGSGKRNPAAYRLTAAGETPIERLNSAGEILLFARYSAKRMGRSVTRPATDGQAVCCRCGDRHPPYRCGSIVAMAGNGSDHLRRRLLAHPLDDTQMGRVVGVSRQAPHRWRNGKRVPEPSLWPRIAEMLGCFEEELFLPPDIARMVRLWIEQKEGRQVPSGIFEAPAKRPPKKKVAKSATK